MDCINKHGMMRRALITLICLLVIWPFLCSSYSVFAMDVLPGEPLIFNLDPNSETNRKPSARVVSSGDGYLCIWEERTQETGNDILGKIVDKSGTLEGKIIYISQFPGDQTQPDIGSDGSGYLVVWSDGRDPNSIDADIYGALIRADGKISKQIPIETGSGNLKLPRVKWNGHLQHYLVAWEDWKDHNVSNNFRVSIYGKRVDPNGQVLDQVPEEIAVDFAFNERGVRPCYDLASMEDPNTASWLIMWSGSLYDPSLSGLDILGRLFYEDPNGDLFSNQLPLQIPIPSTDQYYPSVEGLGNRFLVSWENWIDKEGTNKDIWGVMLGPGGNIISSILTMGSAPKNQTLPEVAHNGQGFFVLWLDQRDSGPDKVVEHLYGLRLSPGGLVLNDDPNVSGGTRISTDSNQRPWSFSVASAGSGDDRYFCFWSAREETVWTLTGRIYDPPPPPVLAWTGLPGYEEDGVDPDAAFGGTPFTFKVEYTSPEGINQAPEKAQMWIDLDDNGSAGEGEVFDMSGEGDPNTDYTTGRVYSYQNPKILYDGDGTLAYTFLFMDSYNVAVGEPTLYKTFRVDPEGHQPYLDWTSKPGFTQDGARPDGAEWDTNTPFEFHVKYRDEDGDPPQNMELWIDKNADGRFDPNHERFAMEAEGASYQQGQIYKKTIRLMLGPDTSPVIFYKFESDDGKNKAVGNPRLGSYVTLNPIGEISACLNTHNQFFPSITSTGSGYQVYWQEQTEIIEPNPNDVPVIKMEFLSETGQVKDGPGEPGQKRIVNSPKGAFKPMARFNPATGNTLLIWEDIRNGSIIEPIGNEENIFKPESIYKGLDIYGIFIDPNGEPVIDPQDPNSAGEFIIGGSTSKGNMLNADMALGGNGQYLVVWESESRIDLNDRTEIWAKLVTEEDFGSGDRIWIEIAVPGREFPGDEHQLIPKVAWNGQYYLVVWQDIADVDLETEVDPEIGYYKSRIYGIRIDPNGEEYPPEDGYKFFNEIDLPDQRGLSDPNVNQLFPDIASDGENFLIVWQDSRALGTDRGYDIYGMRVNVNEMSIDYLDLPYWEIPICTADGHQIRPRVFWDPQAHQYIITWLEIPYPISPLDMLLHRMRFPRAGSIKAVRMDPNGLLIDAPEGEADKYEGTSLAGVAGTQERSDMVCDPDLGCRLIWEDLRSMTSYDLYTASFQSTLDWVDDPNFQNTGVKPAVGAAGGSFTFKVEYRDRSDILPDVSQVWIDLNNNGRFEDSEKFDMEAVDPNASVSEGVIYTYYAEEIGFSQGHDPNINAENIAYRFYFENNKGKTRGLGSGLNIVTLIGAPQLDWTGEPGFTTDGVEPNEAESGTQFKFSVTYTDASGELPVSRQLWIDQDDNGEYGSYERISMKEDDSADTDTSDGKVYTFATKLFYRGDGTIKYRFFFDNAELEAQGEPASDHIVTIISTSKDKLWEIYTKDDGLAGNSATSIEIDQNNIIWAGFVPDFDDPNAGGLSRFDGQEWQTFKGTEYLPDNNVRSLAIQQNDHLWFLTGLGIGCFDGQSWITEKEIDPNTEYINILKSGNDGHVWADIYLLQDPNTLVDPNAFEDPNAFKDPNFEIYGGGIARYDSGEWRFYKRNTMGGDIVSAMDIDTNGIVWAGIIDITVDANSRVYSEYKGIVLFDPNTEQVITRFNSSEGDYPGGDYIRAIYIDGSGDVWVGSQALRNDPNEISKYGPFEGMGLSHYSSEQKEWTQYIDGQNGVSLGSNFVVAIDRREEDLWLGHVPESETLMGGATHHNLTTGIWQVLNSNDSPSGQTFDYINDLAIDAERTVWFATSNGIVRYLPPDTILTFTGDTGFVDGVSPNPGKSGRESEFRVQYSDEKNVPPDMHQVWIDLNANDNYEDDEKFDVHPVNPTDHDYTDGVVYSYSHTINLGDGADISYRFYFEKSGNPVPGTPALDHNLNIEYIPYDDSGSLDIKDSNGILGHYALIPIKIQNAPNSIHSFSFEITYDPYILEYNGYFSGENMKQFDYFDVYLPEGPGILKIGGFELGDHTIQSGSDCIIAFLEFRVIGCEGSNNTSKLTIGNLKDDFLNWSYSGGNFICIIDNDPPIPDMDPLPVIIRDCGAELDESDFPTATDEIAGEIKAGTNDSLNYYEQGEYTVTWIYDDGFGNTTSQEQKIVIFDDESPSISRVDIKPEGKIEYGRSVNLKVNATDNCGDDLDYKWLKGNLIIGEESILTYKFGKGEHNVIVIVRDKAGNTSVSKTKTIKVEPPLPYVPGYGGSNLFGGVKRLLPTGGLFYGSLLPNYNYLYTSNFSMYQTIMTSFMMPYANSYSYTSDFSTYPTIITSFMMPYTNTYSFTNNDYNLYSYGNRFPIINYYNEWSFVPFYDSFRYYNPYKYSDYFPLSTRYSLPQANHFYNFGYTNQLTKYPLNYPQYGTNMPYGIQYEYKRGFSQGNYGKLQPQTRSWQDWRR